MKRLVFAGLMFLTISAFAQENPILKKADSLMNASKYNDAIALYSKLLKTDIKNEMAFRGRGISFLKLGKFAEAKKDYQEAVKLNASCANCYANLALIQIGLNDPVTALSFAEQAIKLAPENGFAYVAKGRALLARNALVDAEAALTKAISLNPKDVEALYWRGVTYNQLSNSEKAYQDFDAITKIDPALVQPYIEKGIIHGNKSELDLALKDFEFAVQLNSADASSNKLVGMVFYHMAQADSALKYLNKAIQLDPKNYEAYFYKASVWYNLENMDSACRDFRNTLKFIPASDNNASEIKQEVEGYSQDCCDSSFAGYYYQRGIAAYNLEKYESAINYYNKGLAKFPGHSMMTAFRGNAYLALKNYKQAEADFTKSLELKNNLSSEIMASRNYQQLSPEEGNQMITHQLLSIYNCRAEARLGLLNIAGAKQDLEEAMKLLPSHPGTTAQTYVLKGIINLQEEDNNLALSAFNKAIGLDPTNERAYLYRALVKTNLAYKTRVITISGSGLNGSFSLPSKEKTVVNTDNLSSALVDVNKAISLDRNFAYAYYVRAMIKIALSQPDFCYDLMKADQLGLEGMQALIKANSCK